MVGGWRSSSGFSRVRVRVLVLVLVQDPPERRLCSSCRARDSSWKSSTLPLVWLYRRIFLVSEKSREILSRDMRDPLGPPPP